MPFKNQDLGWIRVNFKKEADKALRDFTSKTKLAPVDCYEDLDEETKEIIKLDKKKVEKAFDKWR